MNAVMVQWMIMMLMLMRMMTMMKILMLTCLDAIQMGPYKVIAI